MMGGSANISQGLLDILGDADRFKTHVQELHQANLARNKSADDHRQAKREAEAKIAELNALQEHHNNREQEIKSLQAENEKTKYQLGLELAETKRKQLDADRLKQVFEAEKANHQQTVAQFTETVKAHQQNIAQQQLIQARRAQELDDKQEQLKRREADAHVREQFLISAAHELTRPR